MENETDIPKEEFEKRLKEGKTYEQIIDTSKVMTTEQATELKKIHGNKGKKKNFTPEQLENKKKKMREAWAKKKATQTTNQ